MLTLEGCAWSKHCEKYTELVGVRSARRTDRSSVGVEVSRGFGMVKLAHTLEKARVHTSGAAGDKPGVGSGYARGIAVLGKKGAVGGELLGVAPAKLGDGVRDGVAELQGSCILRRSVSSSKRLCVNFIPQSFRRVCHIPSASYAGLTGSVGWQGERQVRLALTAAYGSPLSMRARTAQDWQGGAVLSVVEPPVGSLRSMARATCHP